MILAYKKIGQTPLEVVNRLKKDNKTLSYAGRLDPMAEGLLLILEGDENKMRRRYEHLDKEYEFEVILGFSTDSFDLLGIVKPGSGKEVDSKRLELFLERNKGKVMQGYPPYSSFKISGKPLYWWSRKKLEIKIPEREVFVNRLHLLGSYEMPQKKLKNEILKRIKLVHGDFRQEEIKESWETFFKNDKRKGFKILKFKIECSGGYYVRSFANDLGESLGTKAACYSIKRTRIGEFGLEDLEKTPLGIL